MRRGGRGLVKERQFGPRPPSYIAIHDVDRFPEGVAGGDCAEHAASYYTPPTGGPRVLNPAHTPPAARASSREMARAHGRLACARARSQVSYAGGVLVLASALYEHVNGFSNTFWGCPHPNPPVPPLHPSTRPFPPAAQPIRSYMTYTHIQVGARGQRAVHPAARVRSRAIACAADRQLHGAPRLRRVQGCEERDRVGAPGGWSREAFPAPCTDPARTALSRT